MGVNNHSIMLAKWALLSSKQNPTSEPPSKRSVKLMKTEKPNSSVADVPVNVAGPRRLPTSLSHVVVRRGNRNESLVLYIVFRIRL